MCGGSGGTESKDYLEIALKKATEHFERPLQFELFECGMRCCLTNDSQVDQNISRL